MQSKIRDKYLIHKVIKGDSEAFGQIYEIYITKIYRFVYFKVSDKETAEDITGQVFYKVLSAIRETESKIENLQAFLYRVARNLVIDHYRQNNKEMDLDDDIVGADMELEEKIIENIDINADLEKIRLALEGLKESYRDMIIWYYLEGFQAKEIAIFVDKTPGSVRVLIHRAMTQLKNRLKVS